MKLKNIDFSYPYLRCLNEHFNYEYIFSIQTSCVCTHIERHWKQKVNWDYPKIEICCYYNNLTSEVAVNKGNGIYYLYLQVDYEEYFSLDSSKKKQFLLQLIEINVLKVLEENNLDTKGFLVACEKVRKENFVNQWTWVKKKNSYGLIAEIVAVHDISKFKLYFTIKDRNKLIHNKEIAIEIPNVFNYFSLYGELHWIGNNKVVYKTKRESEFHLDLENNGEVLEFHENNYYKQKSYRGRVELVLCELSYSPGNEAIITTATGKNVEYVFPKVIVLDIIKEDIELSLKVNKFFKKSVIKVIGNNETLISYKRKSILPVLTEEIKIPKFIFDNKEIKEIFISVEECL